MEKIKILNSGRNIKFTVHYQCICLCEFIIDIENNDWKNLEDIPITHKCPYCTRIAKGRVNTIYDGIIPKLIG